MKPFGKTLLAFLICTALFPPAHADLVSDVFGDLASPDPADWDGVD